MNQTTDFSSYGSFDIPKIPKYAITFDLSWNAKSNLTATTDFMSFTEGTVEKLPNLRGIRDNKNPFYSLQLTSGSPN